ncbi:MAG: single-stranded-DNA-specific exonuclease RecJ [Anaerolineae bacterium]
MKDKQWCLRRRENAAFIASHTDLDPLLARILWARRIENPEQVSLFLAENDLHLADPLLLLNMESAVERLTTAIKAHEKVVVYGDFDADGISATALLYSVLRDLGAQVNAYIPDRFAEAYGLNIPAIERLSAEGARLLVTVDCGVRSVAEVEAANGLGLDVIITDHHSVPVVLPPALAVIDPKQAGCPYPYKELSGVGLAYQLARALTRRPLECEPEPSLLDLVAVGTVSDIVPLTGENRILVQHGLHVLRSTPRLGLRALMNASGIVPTKVDSTSIAFRLGPRLNAAGRLYSAQLALDLLTTTELSQADALAQQLSEINSERQSLLDDQVGLAHALMGEDDGRSLLFAAHPDFHEGIVGLVASRLCEEYYRPTLVMKMNGENTRGSARSIEGLHITAALDTCHDLLQRYGGHARAAGFSLATSDLEAFRERLQDHLAAVVQEDSFIPRLLVDAIVPLDLITPGSPAALLALEPVGEQNPEPTLATLGLQLKSVRTVGTDAKHLKLEVSDGQRSLPVIAFRQGAKAAELKAGQRIDLVYRPSLESWQGRETLQLVAQDIRIHTEIP